MKGNRPTKERHRTATELSCSMNNTSCTFPTCTLGTVFTDGIHIIYSYLETEEWSNIIRISKRFYSIAQKSERSRNIVVTPRVHSSQLQLCASSLRRHIGTLTHNPSPDGRLKDDDPIVFFSEQFVWTLKSLPSLTSFAVEVKEWTIHPSCRHFLPITRLTHLHLHSSEADKSTPSRLDNVILSSPTFAPLLTHLRVSGWMMTGSRITLLSLLELKSLTRLDLEAKPDPSNSVRQIAMNLLILLTEQFQHLLHLSFIVDTDLMRSVLHHSDCRHVKLPQMREITQVVLKDVLVAQSHTSALVAAFPGLTKLEIKTIEHQYVILLSLLTQLKSLTIRNVIDTTNQLANEQLIAGLCECRSLTHLDCNRPPIRSVKYWSQLFSALPELTSIKIVGHKEDIDMLSLLVKAKIECSSVSVASRVRSLDLSASVTKSQLRDFLPHALHLQRFIYHSNTLKQPKESEKEFVKVKSIFSSREVLPQLERLEIYYQLGFFTFIWDKKNQYQYNQHRLRNGSAHSLADENFRTIPAATPPSSRLVGIELNPGPHHSAMNLNSLFNDGIHIIYSYLTHPEWNLVLRTSKRYYAIAQINEPCRHISILPSVSSSPNQPATSSPFSVSSLMQSSLRRHIVYLSANETRDPTNINQAYQPQFHVMKPDEFIMSFEHLSSLTSLACEVDFLYCIDAFGTAIPIPSQTTMQSQSVMSIRPTTKLMQLRLHERTHMNSAPTIASLLSHLTWITPHLQQLELYTPRITQLDLMPLSTLTYLRHLTLSEYWGDKQPTYPFDRLTLRNGELPHGFSQLRQLTNHHHFSQLTSLRYMITYDLWPRLISHPRWNEIVIPSMIEITPNHGNSMNLPLTLLHQAFPRLSQLSVYYIPIDELSLLHKFTSLSSLSYRDVTTPSESILDSTPEQAKERQNQIRAETESALTHMQSLTSLSCSIDLAMMTLLLTQLPFLKEIICRKFDDDSAKLRMIQQQHHPRDDYQFSEPHPLQSHLSIHSVTLHHSFVESILSQTFATLQHLHLDRIKLQCPIPGPEIRYFVLDHYDSFQQIIRGSLRETRVMPLLESITIVYTREINRLSGEYKSSRGISRGGRGGGGGRGGSFLGTRSGSESNSRGGKGIDIAGQIKTTTSATTASTAASSGLLSSLASNKSESSDSSSSSTTSTGESASKRGRGMRGGYTGGGRANNNININNEESCYVKVELQWNWKRTHIAKQHPIHRWIPDGSPIHADKSNSIVVPPAAPLVGIELNPGPAEMNLNSLFKDGVHVVLSFLNTKEWNTMISTSKRFHTIAQTSEPCRRISIPAQVSIQQQPILISLMCRSSLRRHIIALSETVQWSKVESHNLHYFHPLSMEQLEECLTTLSCLETIAVDLLLEENEFDQFQPITLVAPRLTRLDLHESGTSPAFISHLLPQLHMIAPQLTHLSLYSQFMTDVLLDSLLECHQLRSFVLNERWHETYRNGRDCEGAVKQLLLLTQQFQHLTSITYMCDHSVWELLMCSEEAEEWLTRIHLPAMRSTPACDTLNHEILKQLHTCFPSLEELHMIFWNVSPMHDSEEAGGILMLSKFASLQSLTLYSIHGSILPMSTIVNTFSSCTSLTHLTTGIGFTPLEWRQVLTTLPHLTSLHVSSPAILEALTTDQLQPDPTSSSSPSSSSRSSSLSYRISRLVVDKALHLQESVFNQFLTSTSIRHSMRELTLTNVQFHKKSATDSFLFLQKRFRAWKNLPQLEYLMLEVRFPKLYFEWRKEKIQPETTRERRSKLRYQIDEQ